MSKEDQLRWNQRFADGAYQGRTHPSDLLAQHQNLLQSLTYDNNAHALDIACGLGRNSAYLLKHGFNVTAVDISDVALSAFRKAYGDSSQLSIVAHDLDQGLPELDRQFDVILKIRFLSEPLLRTLRKHLKPKGLLIVEVLMQTEENQTAGPKASRFRIAPGGLREALAELNILHYHEGTVTDPDGKVSVVAQAIAQRCE